MARRGDDVVQPIVAGQLAVGRLIVPDAQAIVAGGDEGVGTSRSSSSPAICSRTNWSYGLSSIEGTDDVIAVTPDFGLGLSRS